MKKKPLNIPDPLSDEEADAILHNIMGNQKDDDLTIEILTPEQFYAALTKEIPDLPIILRERFATLNFTGDFATLGLTVNEALAMDMPTLARHINEMTGIAQHCADQREQANQERNKQWMVERANKNRFG